MASKPHWIRYRLSTLMLVVTITALGLAVGRWAPGLSILGVIITSGVAVRTLSAIRRSQELGDPMTAEDKILTAVVSLGFTTLIVLGSWIAFFATCWISLLVQAG